VIFSAYGTYPHCAAPGRGVDGDVERGVMAGVTVGFDATREGAGASPLTA
jgi:hypothetical protein